MRRRDVLRALGAMSLPGLSGLACGRRGSETEDDNAKRVRVVLKYQTLGEPTAFRELLASFARANPDVDVVAQVLPSATDLSHQFFLTALEGRARDFDVFIVDVVWAAEFARAGWTLDLSTAFPPDLVRREFLPGPAEAVIVDDKTVAVPWYVDAGVLFYRADLLSRAPRTYDELAQFSADVIGHDPHMFGYVWQGR